MIEAGEGRRLEQARDFRTVGRQRVVLHYVACVQVLQSPAQDGGSAMQSVLHGVVDPVGLPETNEARNGVNIGMAHGALEVKLKWNGRKEARIEEAQAVLEEEVRRARRARSERKRGRFAQVNMERRILRRRVTKPVRIQPGPDSSADPTHGAAYAP